MSNAQWIANSTGHIVVLGWIVETFGEHHSTESGIFDFLNGCPSVGATSALTRHRRPVYVVCPHTAALAFAPTAGLTDAKTACRQCDDRPPDLTTLESPFYDSTV